MSSLLRCLPVFALAATLAAYASAHELGLATR